LAAIDDGQRRVCGAPARNLGSLAVQSGERGGGEWRGSLGLLIGTAGARIRQGVTRNEEGRNLLRGSVSGEKFGWRRKKVTWPDRWDPPISERKGK
jgi:hypothetical protein